MEGSIAMLDLKVVHQEQAVTEDGGLQSAISMEGKWGEAAVLIFPNDMKMFETGKHYTIRVEDSEIVHKEE